MGYVGYTVGMGTHEKQQQVKNLMEQAANADRDANSEWPGSYYRKAHRARARRYRAKAQRLAAEIQRSR